ncbi:hypothetical protein GCM10020256_03840 [Streptomyces thermocoprophilus]
MKSGRARRIAEGRRNSPAPWDDVALGRGVMKPGRGPGDRGHGRVAREWAATARRGAGGQACPVSKRLTRPPETVKTHRVRMLPQVELV